MNNYRTMMEGLLGHGVKLEDIRGAIDSLRKHGFKSQNQARRFYRAHQIEIWSALDQKAMERNETIMQYLAAFENERALNIYTANDFKVMLANFALLETSRWLDLELSKSGTFITEIVNGGAA